MQQLLFIFFLLIMATSCNNIAGNNEVSLQTDSVITPRFPNVVKTEQYGDSVRIETENRGDTLIKHFIDLKGGSDDDFDDSFTATCTYESFPNNSLINPELHFTIKGYSIHFELQAAINFCDSIIKADNLLKDNYTRFKTYILDQVNNKAKNSEDFSVYNLADLIQNLPFTIEHTQLLKRPKFILAEHYTTEFSGGDYFYLVTQAGDTLNLFHNLHYMR